jgi:hypothetical protein
LLCSFPRTWGNRGQNVLPVKGAALRLARTSPRVPFVAYHWRISGNFIFRWTDETNVREAIEVGRQVIGLRCVARTFDELKRVAGATPAGAEVIRSSVVLETSLGPRRVIVVALSEPVPSERQVTGTVNGRTQILSWPSARDVLCLYERPGESGDVGQVTRAVVGAIGKLGALPGLYGTGRAMGVVRDLLAGRGVTWI